MTVACALEAGEVVIERRGAGLFINPKRGRWDLFFNQPGIDVDFGELRHGGTPRDVDLDLDTDFTTQALVEGALLVTDNIRGFQRVAGLRLTNWLA